MPRAKRTKATGGTSQTTCRESGRTSKVSRHGGNSGDNVMSQEAFNEATDDRKPDSLAMSAGPACWADFVLEFLHRLATCHACGCTLIFESPLPHCIDCPADCGDCDEEHDPLSDADHMKAIECARRLCDAGKELETMKRELRLPFLRDASETEKTCG